MEAINDVHVWVTCIIEPIRALTDYITVAKTDKMRLVESVTLFRGFLET